jgi:hypothetical protein
VCRDLYVSLPLRLVHEISGRRMESYMLSGIFQSKDNHRRHSASGGVAVMQECTFVLCLPAISIMTGIR